MGRIIDLAYNDLRQWIAALEKAGELKRIQAEVDPILEISEIADRVSKLGPPTHTAGGPALLFENVKGYPGAKVLMNQFGSERRMKLALGVDSLNDVADRIRELMNLRSPEGFLDKVRMIPMLAEMGKFFPKLVAAKDAPCKEVILRENFSVLDFPILQCWPQDGGQHCRMGKSRTLKFSRRMTSLQGASLAATSLGKNFPISASMGIMRTLS